MMDENRNIADELSDIDVNETPQTTTSAPDRGSLPSTDIPETEARLRGQVANWRKKLLDLGNRNPLINCSFNASRGVLEILHPTCEAVWRKLAADSEAGADTMRFPWRYDLVPPPTQRKSGNLRSIADIYSDLHRELERGLDAAPDSLPKEWFPPLDECIKSRHLRASDLLTGASDRVLDRRLRTLDSYANLSLSEQGVHSLYVAFGFLKWFESTDSAQELRSPLMLVPVELSRASADAPWQLTEAEDDAVDNLCLRQRMKQDFGLELPPLPDINELEEPGARTAFLNAVRQAISENPRWEVEDRCALGRFAFPKVAMWKDVGDHLNSIVGHALCRSIGGDDSILPQDAFGVADGLPDAAQLDDEIAPGEIKAILDCDSSQLEAIVAARRGVSFVLDGPPGTGKSQTIANIIADALAEGRRVLFVSEKVSALEVVKRRLDDCGLGDFCLECHSSKANRKAVLDELQWCLNLSAEVYPDIAPKYAEARQKRDSLNRYVRQIHKPRDPWGFSPYDLFGRVTRLARLGLAAKSRCQLPQVAEVDRETFAHWMHLLDRARDHAVIIGRYNEHAWRNCLLTSRSLSLADDLQHHLAILAKSFCDIDQATGPLVAEQLLPTITPRTLNELIPRLRDLDQVPVVPASWFVTPQQTADAVLAKLAADEAVHAAEGALSHYVDDLTARFPHAAVAELCRPDGCAWLGRCRAEPPDSVVTQLAEFERLVAHLQAVAHDADQLATVFASLLDLMEIRPKAPIPVQSLLKYVELARAITECVPLRPDWLDSNCWTGLRQCSHLALGKLREAATSAARVSERLPVERMGQLCRSIGELPAIESAWNKVRQLSPSGAEKELRQLATASREALTAAQTVNQTAGELLRACGGAEGGLITARAATGLAAPEVGGLAEAGFVHRAWKEASVRSRLRQVCESALSDLTEAAELQEVLQERLSHRAFKSTAAELAQRAARYQSLLARLFGGFGAFRTEATDLYKAGLPDTRTFLSDCERLRTYHRRVNAVRDSVEDLTDSLPAGAAVTDLAFWKRLKLALGATEALLAAVPAVYQSLPSAPVELDGSTIDALRNRLRGPLAALTTALQHPLLSSAFHDGLPLQDLVDELAAISQATDLCLTAWDRAGGHYAALPLTLDVLVADLRDAQRHSALVAEVSAIFDNEQELMPQGGVALDETCWQRILAGIDAAEKLSSLVRSPQILKDILYTPGRISLADLSLIADQVETAAGRLQDSLDELESQFSLTHPDEVELDPRKRSATALQALATTAARELESRVQRLREVREVLRPGEDVALDQLPEDAARVLDLAEALRIRETALQGLQELGADPGDDLHDGGAEAAAWLQSVVETEALNPLTRGVASSADIRQSCAEIERNLNEILTSIRESWKFLRTLFELKERVSWGVVIMDSPAASLAQYFNRLLAEASSIDEWLMFSRWRRDLTDNGFGEVVDELLAGVYRPEEASDAIGARFYRQLYDHLAQVDPTLGDFNLESHERLRERFRELDQWEVKVAATRIRQFQLGRVDRPRPGWSAPATSELGLLQKETQKKRRHMPLRKLFSEIPGVLQRLKPCIMMSPLSVSTFLQSDELRFELVIFDEASQVFPWDAIGAIYRGTQLIVAGDEKQLPPTNFFNRAESETEDEDDDIGDFESILSLCKSINMPNKGLRWHYRSRREPLIAFSNHHFYNGELVTFPSVHDATGDAVRLELVREGRWTDRRNVAEAQRIADLVIQHLRTTPDKSLGVIAFNTSQQAIIEDALYERRRNDPTVDAIFDDDLTEPLFIKNLENVQGDERDVILLSMGYGYNEAGRFLKNFGPLTKSGGERRLNVAITRARQQIVFVASVSAADMDLSGSTSAGAALLKAYLEYAERGVSALGTGSEATGGEHESPFEEEVAQALRQRGLTPVPQVGCSGFRIDLALKHPDRPGEFCLGIECDGATYHSSKTARDRDRIRQSILEHLGWNIVRIWSTDWVRSPERQIERVLAAYEQARHRPRGSAILESPAASETASLDEDLQPRIVEHSQSTPRSFDNIDSVPDGQIRATAMAIVVNAGAIDFDDLVKQVARELGFRRTGKNIRDRLEKVLQVELNTGKLRRIGERIAAPLAE